MARRKKPLNHLALGGPLHGQVVTTDRTRYEHTETSSSFGLDGVRSFRAIGFPYELKRLARGDQVAYLMIYEPILPEAEEWSSSEIDQIFDDAHARECTYKS